MNKFFYNFNLKIILIFIIFLFPNLNDAKEILIYADKISYDENENLVAEGNAKIFQSNKLILSDLIIYNKNEEKNFLPLSFTFKDENNNYFEGENGYFLKNLEFAEFDNPKIRLNDGSRIVGKKVKRDGYIDIISKGVYSPCKSRIKIADFICANLAVRRRKNSS